METKLTLKLDKDIIVKAKAYASIHNRSLSELIESYLKSLIALEGAQDSDVQITPFVKSLATGVRIPTDLDYKKEYTDYLEEKYK